MHPGKLSLRDLPLQLDQAKGTKNQSSEHTGTGPVASPWPLGSRIPVVHAPSQRDGALFFVGGGRSTSMKQQPITGSDGLRERRKTDDPNSSLLVSRRVAFISMRLTAHPLAHGPLQNEPSTSR